MNLELDDIPSGYTPTIQPRSLPGLATVGSPISSTYASGIYTFDVSALANADYQIELIGVSVPTRRFYIRKTSTSAFIIAEPGGSSIPPPATPNTCRVRIVSTKGMAGVPARVLVESALTGRQDERAFLKVAHDGPTDEDGELLIDLAWSSNPGVGPYRIRLFELTNNLPLHDRKVTVPDLTNADYGDLVTSI